MTTPPDTVAPAATADALNSGRPDGSTFHVPVNARGVALAIMATLAFVFALQWARSFFIPLVFSVLMSYTLTPLVSWLENLRLPRLVASALVMLALVCGIAAATNSLLNEFQSILVRLPDAAHDIAQVILKTRDGQPGTMQQMQAAATEIEKAATQAPLVKSTGRGMPAAIVVARTPFSLQDWLLAGSMGAVGMLSQTVMMLFLTFFLLCSGDKFKRKLVKITGPSLSSKKITVHILDDINHSIQRYMFMLLVTNGLLALIMWIALRWIGLENAGAWALTAGLLHVIPYFGQLIIAVATGLTAYMQFGTLSGVLLVAGTSLVVATVVGTFITTWMTGKITRMNAAAIFIGLLFWGWLWGFWGLLLGVPIIVMVRVIAEHVDGLQSVAELLSE
jgi:predicted PurR-regulated permease PerM